MPRKNKKSWKDMTPRQRAGVVMAGAVQLTLMVSAQRSISKTPAAQIRGNKAVWRAASFINFFGPLSYFLFGRRRGTA
jgi:hypothetical protein